MRSIRGNVRALVGVSAVLAILVVLAPAGAAPGDLDPSFGAGGTVETQISSRALVTGLAIQPDGKIVAGGNSYPPSRATLARYELNGALDESFGSRGIATGPESNVIPLRALALQPDGKILLAGISSDPSTMRSFFSVSRYLPDGSPDPTFGSEGIVRGPDGGASSLALQADGRIVVVGTEPENYAFKLVRLNADGTLDSSFGSNGSVRTLLGYAASASASAVVVQPDGRILAAGASVPGNPPPPPPPPPAPPPPPPPGLPPLPWRATLARYNADGSLDPSFGSSGVVTTELGERRLSAPGASLALQPDGSIVAASQADRVLVWLARYRSDGVLDPAFGSSGIVRTKLRSSGYGLALQADGMVVLAGGQDGVARYRGNGSPDPAFGVDGVAQAPPNAAIHAVALQQDGRIVTGGPRNSRFALARYLSKSPTTIGAAPRIVGYGRTAVIKGTLSLRRAGLRVQILKRGCYDFATRAAATTRTGPGGTWQARVRPGSRTVFTAKVEGETSSPLAVGVRPKLILTKLSDRRFRAQVLAARSLDDVVVLQRFARNKWIDVRLITLRRIAKRGSGVVSGRTFRASKLAGQRVRLSFGNAACYAAAASQPITG